jgi:UDPglucose 6-dehydrogenase
MSSIGVIGNGFVGSAVVYAFKQDCNVKIFDLDANRATNTFEETINQDIVFICVPTPMVDVEGGECNLSIVETVFEQIAAKNKRTDNAFVIKSTIPIGMTREFYRRYPNINIVHSPEFLTAKNAKIDFITSSRHIIGIPFYDGNTNQELHDLYTKRFQGSLILTMDSNESEFVKYACNCYFATKVSYFNEIKLLSDKLDLDWNLVMDGVLSDGRIAKSHTSVPGHDGDRGFGGTCFPKDINSLIHIMETYGLDPMILKASWQQNKNVRTDWDWAKHKSAVMSKN